MNKSVIILGASGIGRIALEIFNLNEVITYCFLDDDESLHNTEVDEIPVISSTKDDGILKYIGNKCQSFVAEEDISKRKDLIDFIIKRRKINPINAVHPKATLFSTVQLGYSNIINAGVVVNPGVKIGNGCMISANTVIESEVEIGDFSTINASSIIGSKVKIAENVFVGSGAIVTSGIKIGKGAKIAPGALVMQEVKEGTTVFGSPAKEV